MAFDAGMLACMLHGRGTLAGWYLVLTVVFFAIGALLLVLAAWLATAAVTFAFCPKKTAKIGAVLEDVEHKKNVTVRTGRRRPTSRFYKHASRGRYVYTVAGKRYRIRGETHWGSTPRQIPKFVPVVYVKRWPRMAYIESDIFCLHGVYAAISGVFGILALNLVFTLLARG